MKSDFIFAAFFMTYPFGKHLLNSLISVAYVTLRIFQRKGIYFLFFNFSIRGAAMKYPKYEYSTESDLHFFEFTSTGKQGNIKKMVQYSKLNVDNFYNLAFGDYNEDTDDINDKIASNNGDSSKVLATVASTVYAFTEKYPDSWVFATGSNEVRTLLYRMGIANNLEELSRDFFVYGMKQDDTSERFVKGVDYWGFLVTRKNKMIGQ